MTKGYETDFQQLALDYKAEKTEMRFYRLYKAIDGKIRGFMLKRINNPTIIDDAMGSFYLALAKNFDIWDPKRAMFSTWMYTIASKCCVNMAISRSTYEGRCVSPEEISSERNKTGADNEMSLSILYEQAGEVEDEETIEAPIFRERLCSVMSELYDELTEGERIAYEVMIYRNTRYNLKVKPECMDKMTRATLDANIKSMMNTVKKKILQDERYSDVVSYLKSQGFDTTYVDNSSPSIFDFL